MNHLLNHAGKEVLIKAVVTAIPTYVMNVFKLPTTWCSDINVMIARFWWGEITEIERFIGRVGMPRRNQRRKRLRIQGIAAFQLGYVVQHGDENYDRT